MTEVLLTFALDEEMLQKSFYNLKFERLDTYAKVYLNDSLILGANNAFRTWNVASYKIKPLLRLENELHIVFESTSKHEEAERSTRGVDSKGTLSHPWQVNRHGQP